MSTIRYELFLMSIVYTCLENIFEKETVIADYLLPGNSVKVFCTVTKENV
jgi:hypothetical protein